MHRRTVVAVLIIVAALAALVLAGLLAVVVCMTRTQKRHGNGGTIPVQTS